LHTYVKGTSQMQQSAPQQNVGRRDETSRADDALPPEDDQGYFHRGFEGRKLGRNHDRNSIASPYYGHSHETEQDDSGAAPGDPDKDEA
jgi:hypothetical protein